LQPYLRCRSLHPFILPDVTKKQKGKRRLNGAYRINIDKGSRILQPYLRCRSLHPFILPDVTKKQKGKRRLNGA
ncbi:MAG: hypothetical protein J6Q72_04900, partial [Clostridia bacterium]|nr:hypothetical protein [Clostridia bacterium]